VDHRTEVTELVQPLVEQEPEFSDVSNKALLKHIIGAAWPQATVVACRNLVDLTNAAVLGWLGTDELAAAAFSGLVTGITGVVLWQGFGDALITLTSQAIGAGNPRLAGVWLQTSIVAICVGALPIGLLWWFTGDILGLVQISPHVQDLASTFSRYSLIWLLPDAAFSAFSQWLNAQQLVRETILINIFFVLFNFAANVILVHGLGFLNLSWLTFGGWGFVGSPLASSLTKILRACVTVWWVCSVRRLHEKTWHPWTWACLNRDRLITFMGQALPSGIAGFLEQGQFVVVTLLIATFGEVQVAAHTGMLNVFGFLTFGMYGLTDAGAATVGLHLGKGHGSVAKRGALMLLLCMGVMGMGVAALFLGGENYVGKIFSQDPLVWQWTKKLSVVLGVSYLAISLTFASSGVLSGQGRPQVAAMSMFFGLWGVSLPMAYLLGLHLNGGLTGVWDGLVAGYMTMTLIMAFFVARSDWSLLAVAAQKRSEMETHRPLVATEIRAEA
jgi:MATE family multidrug resistance protein